MKNSLRLLSATAAVALFSLSACDNTQEVKPDRVAQQPAPEVSVKNGRMVFKDRSVFEQYSTSIGNVPANTSVEAHLDAVEKKFNFYSLRSMFHPLAGTPVGRTADACQIDDDYLASMLSPEGIVQIGEWIYKVDVCNEKVYALPVAEEAYVAELKEKTPSHEKIQVFSTDDEVLDLIEAGETGDPTARTAICTSESGADRKDDKDYIPYNIYGTDFRMDCKLVYQKAGIYFSLQGKVKTEQKSGSGLWVAFNAPQWINYEAFWEPKCRSTSYGSDYCTTCYSVGNEYNRRLWESSRALHRYSYRATFRSDIAVSRLFVIEDL